MNFPRHLHQTEGRYVVVNDAETADKLLAGGWLPLPPAHVEKPVEVRVFDALSTLAVPKDVPPDTLVTELNGNAAAVVIAGADAVTLEAIEAEELAGKARKGVLAAIDARKAELSA